jgi:hypothetical protein
MHELFLYNHVASGINKTLHVLGREQLLMSFLYFRMQCVLLSTEFQAVTAEHVLTKFENSRQGLLESLHQVEETIPEAVGSQVVHNL